MALSCIISEKKLARYLSKIAIISYPLHSTPPLGGPRRNIAISFGIEKLEWCDYRTVKNNYDAFSRFNRIPACDRRTDRHLATRCIVRAIHSLRCITTTSVKQELSYRKQIARQLRTQYVEGIHRPKYYTVTLKSRLRVTQGLWKRNHWTNHIRLSNYLTLNIIVTLKCGLSSLKVIESGTI